jgi:hypothetical protein
MTLNRAARLYDVECRVDQQRLTRNQDAYDFDLDPTTEDSLVPGHGATARAFRATQDTRDPAAMPNAHAAWEHSIAGQHSNAAVEHEKAATAHDKANALGGGVAHDRAADLHREAADLHRRAAAAEAATGTVNRRLVMNDRNREGMTMNEDNLPEQRIDWSRDPRLPEHQQPGAQRRRDRPVTNAAPPGPAEVLLDDGLPLPATNAANAAAASFDQAGGGSSAPIARSPAYGFDVEHRTAHSASELLDTPDDPGRHDTDALYREPDDADRAAAARAGRTDWLGHPDPLGEPDEDLPPPGGLSELLARERGRGT